MSSLYTLHTWRAGVVAGLALALGAMSGCVSVSEFQDAQIVPKGDSIQVIGGSVQLQRGQRLGLDKGAKHEEWPLFTVAGVGLFRQRLWLSPDLEWSYHVTSPALANNLIMFGLGAGLKGHLAGVREGRGWTSAWLVRGEGAVMLLGPGGDNEGGAGASTTWTGGLMMSRMAGWGSLTIMSKGVAECVAVAEGGSGCTWSMGGTLGARFGQRSGLLLETTLLFSPALGRAGHDNGLLAAFGIGVLI